MPYTDFHYTPTGTGVISGKEVLEQTEDAINDLGGQISGDVQTAIDTANNALNVANTASTDAQNAVNTANTAYTAATNAQNTANAAQTTATNALTAAQNAQNDVNALGNRVTTAENNITQNTTDISGLTTRMGTAEGNITTLQNDVVTAQGTATSAQNTATMARQQAYVLRYSSTAITDNSTIAYSTLDNTDNIKATDKIIDVDGKIFSIVSVDSDNSTVTVGSALIDLALDANVVHTSGNETVNGIKSFTSIINMIPNGIGTHGCVIKVPFSRGDTENTEGSVLTSTNHATFRVIDKDSNIISETCTENYVDGKVAQILNVRNTDDNGNQVQSSISHLLDKNAEQDWLYPTINNKVMLGTSTYKWKSVYATNYYYGASNTEFSDKFVTTDTNQTISGNKTFSSINGVEPSSLFLPDLDNGIDISGYINVGQTSQYTAPADGYISISCHANTNNVVCIKDASYDYGTVVRAYQPLTPWELYAVFPVIKNHTYTIIFSSQSSITLDYARFFPCLGNV